MAPMPPSKRRKLHTEADDPSPPQNQPDLTITRSSLRSGRATRDKCSDQKQNGVDGEVSAASTKQRRAGTSKNANGAAAGVENGVKTAATRQSRSSARSRQKTELSDPTDAVEQPTSGRKSKGDFARASKSSTKPKSSKKKQISAVDDPGKTVGETPSDYNPSIEKGEDGLREESPNKAPAATNGGMQDFGHGAHGPNGDVLDAATQLQYELNDTDECAHSRGTLPHYAEEFKSFCEKGGCEDVVGYLGRFVMEKLCAKRRVPLKGLDSGYSSVHNLIEQTVVAGEGNSMLLLGARGCGKSAVVDTAISAMMRDHSEDFHVVRLNGFLHTDDKIALREIWRQLGRETGSNDDVSKVSSYADTMATLLALLSHPEELSGPSADPDTMTTTKSVIIVLDEFDLFSHHPRQTLLYNLFDIAQAKKAPIAVLGLTTKLDVTENLEKRVKSRFSHRYVFLPRPRTFSEFADICLSALKIEEDELSHSGVMTRGGSENKTVTTLRTKLGGTLVQRWNTFLQGLWHDATLQTQLQRIFHLTRCPKDFFTCALGPVSDFALQSSPGAPRIPTGKSFTWDTVHCADPPPLPFPVPANGSTSTISLPLSLLLTATRLTALHDPALNASQTQAPGALTLSFAAVYAEYVRLLTSAKASASASGSAATPGRIWGKDLARESWEKLVDWGLIVPVSTGSATGDTRMFRIEISFEEVVDGMGEGGSGALGRWWRET